jgi:hypothetical protein
VVDATAAFSLISWEIVNNASGGGAQAGRAVRDQLMRAAGNTPAMLKLTNTEKQQASEMLAFQVVMDASMCDSFTKRGLTDKLQILRSQVREAAMKLGPDPAKLKLTPAVSLRRLDRLPTCVGARGDLADDRRSLRRFVG